jgi:hypothetical protein
LEGRGWKAAPFQTICGTRLHWSRALTAKAALVSLIQTIALENKDLAITANAGKDVNGAAIPVYGSSL